MTLKTMAMVRSLLAWAVVGLCSAGIPAQNGGVDPANPGEPGDPADPPDPGPDCWTACEIAFQEALQPCIDANGGGAVGVIDEACAAGAKQTYEACLTACGPAPPPPPPDPGLECLMACEAAFQEALQPCISPDGTVDQECAGRAGAAYEDCLKQRCNIGPDPQQLCLLDCDARFQEASAQCVREDGSLDPDCLVPAKDAYSACVTACGVTVPEEILCGMACEAAYFAALGKCTTDPALGPNEIDGECAEAAHRAFETCFAACGIDVPDEIACASGCDQSLGAALAACGDDLECQQLAFAGYDECLRGCGFAIPDLPDPDPCFSACDRAYSEAASACFDPTNQEPDQECLAAVDQKYIACLEGCGVVPGPFPVPPEQAGCLGHCDSIYQKEVAACADPATNMLDPECVEAANQALTSCLDSCGVEIPDDMPGVPSEECARQCQDRFGDALRTCILADGSLDPECAARVEQEIEACMAGCEADGQARVLAALGRTAGGEFLRGDANLDQRRDITDAVLTLGFLFSGGPGPACADGADANDDGLLNVTDPIALLDFLFRGTGPLPAPASEPGVDPTADGLDC